MKNYTTIKDVLQNRAERSAWDKGVTLYALELLENVRTLGKSGWTYRHGHFSRLIEFWRMSGKIKRKEEEPC